MFCICTLRNGSRVCKSDEGLMMLFIDVIDVNDVIFPSEKHAARQFKQNYYLTFYYFYWLSPISVLLMQNVHPISHQVEYHQILFEKKGN